MIFVIPVLGMFAHVVALIALSPIFYFSWSPDTPARRWSVLIVGTPVFWSMMFYGSYIGGQFLQSSSIIGLLAAAGISTALMGWGFEKQWFEKREWVVMVMLFVFPSIGYLVGYWLSA